MKCDTKSGWCKCGEFHDRKKPIVEPPKPIRKKILKPLPKPMPEIYDVVRKPRFEYPYGAPRI